MEKMDYDEPMWYVDFGHLFYLWVIIADIV